MHGQVLCIAFCRRPFPSDTCGLDAMKHELAPLLLERSYVAVCSAGNTLERSTSRPAQGYQVLILLLVGRQAVQFNLLPCQSQQLRDFLRVVAPSKTSYEMRPALGSVLTAGGREVLEPLDGWGRLVSVAMSSQAFECLCQAARLLQHQR